MQYSIGNPHISTIHRFPDHVLSYLHFLHKLQKNRQDKSLSLESFSDARRQGNQNTNVSAIFWNSLSCFVSCFFVACNLGFIGICCLLPYVYRHCSVGKRVHISTLWGWWSVGGSKATWGTSGSFWNILKAIGNPRVGGRAACRLTCAFLFTLGGTERRNSILPPTTYLPLTTHYFYLPPTSTRDHSCPQGGWLMQGWESEFLGNT